jgi:5'-deoxynucleotidase
MPEFTLHQLMRTGHVKRWQIVRVAREQTIAEHMYRVFIIAGHICSRLRVDDKTGQRAMAWALAHDVPEVVTGDIATPAKEAMRKALPQDDPIRNIELNLSDHYRHVYLEAKEPAYPNAVPAYEIVKLADLIEAKCFLACEMMGNHAKEVYDGMCTQVRLKYESLGATYPIYDWSLIKDVINDSWLKV